MVIADIDETAAQQAAQRLQLEGVAASAFRCDVGVKDEVGEYAVVTQQGFQVNCKLQRALSTLVSIICKYSTR